MTYCCWLAQWEQHYCCLSLSSLLLLLYTGHRKVLVVFSFLILLSIGCFLLQYFFVTYNVGNNNNTSSYYQGRVAVPHCSYLMRECKCPRNLFYLRPQRFCDFTFDVNLSMESQWESDQRLTVCGRSVRQMLMPCYDREGWQSVPPINPLSTHRKQFVPGLFQSYVY